MTSDLNAHNMVELVCQRLADLGVPWLYITDYPSIRRLIHGELLVIKDGKDGIKQVYFLEGKT